MSRAVPDRARHLAVKLDRLFATDTKEAYLPDTITQLKAILARTLRELEQIIDNATVRSLLRGLGGTLGVEDDGATTTTKPASRRAVAARPKRVTAARASTARAARLAEQKAAQANLRARAPAASRRPPRLRARARARLGPRGGGRRDQLLAVVLDQPGITLAQAGKQFGLKDATGLYEVARRLQADGLVRKSGIELDPTAKGKQT